MNYTPKFTFESTKSIRESLGFECSVGIGAVSWAESVYSSFANMTFESCLFNACSAALDNLTYHVYSNLKTAVGITCIGANLFSGEYSFSDIGFGIGFVGAPTAIGMGFGGIVSATGFRSFGFGSFSGKISAPRLTYAGTNVTSNPILGGGAKLSYLGSNVERIQKIATKYDLEISVVGNRAKGTATAVSDWDYIITGGTSKSRSSALFQLPKNIRATKDGNPIPRSEILKGTLVKLELPHKTFKPKF